MIERKVPVTEDELHALIDGELAADRRRDVDAWLAQHPDDAARVAAWRSQGESLRRRYGGIADEPIPPRFDLDELARSGRPMSRLATVAAVIAAFLLGGIAGWLARPAWEGTPTIKVESSPTVRTVAADAIDA